MTSHPSRARTLAIYEADPAGGWDAIDRDEGKEIGAEAMLKGYNEMVDLHAALTMTPRQNAPTEAEAKEWAQMVYINMIHHVKTKKNMKTVPPWEIVTDQCQLETQTKTWSRCSQTTCTSPFGEAHPAEVT